MTSPASEFQQDVFVYDLKQPNKLYRDKVKMSAEHVSLFLHFEVPDLAKK
jgi:hypothetical protein